MSVSRSRYRPEPIKWEETAQSLATYGLALYVDDRQMSFAEISNSEIYHDFAILSLHRLRGAGRFRPDEMDFFERLTAARPTDARVAVVPGVQDLRRRGSGKNNATLDASLRILGAEIDDPLGGNPVQRRAVDIIQTGYSGTVRTAPSAPIERTLQRLVQRQSDIAMRHAFETDTTPAHRPPSPIGGMELKKFRR